MLLDSNVNKVRNTLLLFILNCLVFASLFTILCPDKKHWVGLEDDDKPLYIKFWNRLYFSMATFTTVGYGDITPKSYIARVLSMCMFVILAFEMAM